MYAQLKIVLKRSLELMLREKGDPPHLNGPRLYCRKLRVTIFDCLEEGERRGEYAMLPLPSLYFALPVCTTFCPVITGCQTSRSICANLYSFRGC